MRVPGRPVTGRPCFFSAFLIASMVKGPTLPSASPMS